MNQQQNFKKERRIFPSHVCAGAALSHFELFTFGKRHLGSSSRAPCVCVCVPCNNYLIISALVRLCLDFLFFFCPVCFFFLHSYPAVIWKQTKNVWIDLAMEHIEQLNSKIRISFHLNPTCHFFQEILDDTRISNKKQTQNVFRLVSTHSRLGCLFLAVDICQRDRFLNS